ncbi:hypothetical protein AKJ51_00770 [candidate division MSBL1 archaeon SCGC-AAA382A20]|uniref:DUF488 domain-containing protein n=1 Tax=candidate division MSBL1 archaeon SCGC-AAA382A20 TaxID=1698280 RepID=A0A133VMF4_9EURY|nr:hypothetical protein AKJ51_00770 [candidate division MSBL1 archaeon SCGC-AAA382A20]
MIKTKSITDRIEDEDGERILVTRYWPRGMSRDRLEKAEWLKEVAPSKELLQDWKNEKIYWPEYCRRYREEMSSRQKKIARLAAKSQDNTITLLCHEPEHNPHCHRHILKKLIQEIQQEGD